MLRSLYRLRAVRLLMLNYGAFSNTAFGFQGVDHKLRASDDRHKIRPNGLLGRPNKLILGRLKLNLRIRVILDRLKLVLIVMISSGKN